MSRTVNTLGGISVVFDTQDEQAVDHALKQLDPGLFLTRNPHPVSRQLVWEVRHWVGSAVPPPLVLVWAEEDGTPRPLSSGLVYAVERRKQHFGRDLVADAEEANRALERSLDDRSQEETDEIVAWFRKGAALGNRWLIPRSPTLARTRARMRSEGRQ